MKNSMKYSRMLQDNGVSREQAETHIQILEEIVDMNLATKEDLRNEVQNLNSKIDTLEYKLTIKIGFMISAAVAALTAINKLL